MKFTEERERRTSCVCEAMMEFNARLTAAQADRLFHLDRTDRSHVAHPDAYLVRDRKGLRRPVSRPQLAVVRITCPFDHSDFIVRKQFVPPATPHVVIPGGRRKTPGPDPPLAPSHVHTETLARALPNLTPRL